MTRQIPVYDVGLNESREVQQRKQKAIAEEQGIDVGDGEKFFLIHQGFLGSSTRGIIPLGTTYERELARYKRVLRR